MIIGSLTGIGTVGQFASIKVTANPGSTVTCTTPKGIILTATEVSGTWLFDRLNTYGNYVINFPPYSETVKVDSAMLYNVGLSYESLNYLQSSGTQYIDTGHTHNATTEFQLKFEFLSTHASHDWNMIMGSRTSFNSVDCLNVYTHKGNYLSYGIGGVYNDDFKAASAGTIYEVTMYKTGIIVNGGLSPLTTNLTSCSKNDWIFAVNGAAATDTKAQIKLYYAKILDNGVLVRDYIPTKRKSDGVLGLFDAINNKFYTNAGTGTFTGA